MICTVAFSLLSTHLAFCKTKSWVVCLYLCLMQLDKSHQTAVPHYPFQAVVCPHAASSLYFVGAGCLSVSSEVLPLCG